MTEAQLQTATPLETYSYNSRGLLDKEVIHITGADTGGNIETRYSYNIGARLETTTGTSQATYWAYNTVNSGDMMN